MLTDRLRSRQDESRRWNERRSEVYTRFLSALHHANEAMRAVALGDRPASSRPAAISEAFRNVGLYEIRPELEMVAPVEVVDAANLAFRSPRRLRDLLISGKAVDSSETGQATVEFFAKLQAATNKMRAHLGPGLLDYAALTVTDAQLQHPGHRTGPRWPRRAWRHQRAQAPDGP